MQEQKYLKNRRNYGSRRTQQLSLTADSAHDDYHLGQKYQELRALELEAAAAHPLSQAFGAPVAHVRSSKDYYPSGPRQRGEARTQTTLAKQNSLLQKSLLPH
jgi:hypothetical protein